MTIMELVGINTNEIKKYRNYTRVVAVLDVVLATLGFFFNPFNDEEADVPFLYWKITITCFIFEIWMIVSINLFVATQKLEDASKSVKYINYWLVVATLSFIAFQALIVFPSCLQLQPVTLYQLYCPTAILIYRLIATMVVIKYRTKLIQYANSVCGQLHENLSQSFPDLLTMGGSGGGGGGCGGQCQCSQQFGSSRSSGSSSSHNNNNNNNNTNNNNNGATMLMKTSDMNLYLNPNNSSLYNNNNNNNNNSRRQSRNNEIRDGHGGDGGGGGDNEQFLRIVQV